MVSNIYVTCPNTTASIGSGVINNARISFRPNSKIQRISVRNSRDGCASNAAATKDGVTIRSNSTARGSWHRCRVRRWVGVSSTEAKTNYFAGR